MKFPESLNAKKIFIVNCSYFNWKKNQSSQKEYNLVSFVSENSDESDLKQNKPYFKTSHSCCCYQVFVRIKKYFKNEVLVRTKISKIRQQH